MLLDPRSLIAALVLAGCGGSGDGAGAADGDGAPDGGGAPAAVSFEPSWTVSGAVPASNLGLTLAALGDLDGDGAVDWAATDWSDHTVTVRSGATGEVLYPIATEDGPDAAFGNAIAALGDIDGDGVPDHAIAAWAADDLAGRVTLHSGAGGEVLRPIEGEPHMELGWPTALDDLDGDGVPELAIGAPGATGGEGAVVVVNGATGATLRTIPGWSSDGFPVALGRAVASVGDVDGDGHVDIVAGAMWDSGDAGAARVLSTATGAVLHEIAPPAEILPVGFGFATAGGGDVDGDGVGDLAVGCAQCSPGEMAESGHVAVYSGTTGALLYGAGGRAVADVFGSTIAFIPDLDGDGRDEWIAAGPANGVLAAEEATGYAEIRSGADGHVVFDLEGPDVDSAFGAAIAVGDFDGDARPDLLLGSPGAAHAAGIVTLYLQR